MDERICAGTAAVIHERGRQTRESREAVARSMEQGRTDTAPAPTIAEQVADADDCAADHTFEAACRLCTLNVGEIHHHRSTDAAIFVFSDNSYASPLPSGIPAVGTFGDEDWRDSGRFECAAEPATTS